MYVTGALPHEWLDQSEVASVQQEYKDCVMGCNNKLNLAMLPSLVTRTFFTK